MKKTTKIITLILSAVLLIGAAIGISVSAAEADPTVSIEFKNLAYEGAVKVIYAVDAQNVPEGAKVQMAFFDSMPASVDETPKYLKDEYEETIEIGGKTYKAFFSNGIAPKDMRKNIYAVPVITMDGEVIALGDPVEYSIYTYAINMFAKSPAEDQKELYSALLDYGASVQQVLLDSGDYTAAELEACGGYADQYCGIKIDTVSDGALAEAGTVTYYRPGEKISYTADLYKDGASFTGFFANDTAMIGDFGTKADFFTSEPGVSRYYARYTTLERDAMDKTGIFGAHNYTGGSATYVTTVAESAENANNVLNIAHPAGVNSGTLQFAYYTSAKAYIFETDIKWAGSTVDRASDNWIMRWGFQSTGSKSLSNADAYVACNYLSAKLDSPLYFTGGSAGYKTETPANPQLTIPKDEWHRVRIEYVPIEKTGDLYYGIQRVYLDGILAEEKVWSSKGDNSDILTFNVTSRGTYDTLDWSMMLDNMVCYSVKEDSIGEGLYANDPDTNTYDGENANHTKGTIVEEADGNKVLELTKANGSGTTIDFKADGIEYGETYVFDSDVKLVSMPYSGWQRNWLGRMGFVSTGTNGKSEDAAFVRRSYFGGTPHHGFILSQSADSTYGAGIMQKESLTPGVWFNLRIEYTITGISDSGSYTGVEKFYINNELVETLNGSCASDNRGLISFRLAFLAKTGVTLRFDNTFVGAIGEPVYAVADFEAGATSGTYFTPSSTNGDAVSEYTVVDNPKGTTVAGAAGKVLKADLTTGANQEVNTIKIVNSDSAAAVGTYELSFDMLFDSTTLPTENSYIQQFVVNNSKGYTALFSLKHTTDGNVYITSDVDGTSGNTGKGGSLGTVKLLDGEWHNLRFVMYTNGADSVYALYVDGELSGIGNYYHGIYACVTNVVAITNTLHRIKTFDPQDTTVTTANLYFDNIGLVYVGDIPADIPDWDAD